MERLINESASSTTVSELCAEYRANNQITKDEYELYHVKRGLRNRDGTGVMAGLTHVCNVHGYLISDGVKMYSDAVDENINFLGRNIYPALRTLRYPHAGNFDNCLTELEASDNHFTCTDVLVDKTQYFLCMKRLTGCDWTMLFLVPGVEVAAGARAMVDSITLIVNIAFFVLMLLTVGAMYFLLTAMQNRERYAVETENAQALAQANAELEQARQAAVDAQ